LKNKKKEMAAAALKEKEEAARKAAEAEERKKSEEKRKALEAAKLASLGVDDQIKTLEANLKTGGTEVEKY